MMTGQSRFTLTTSPAESLNALKSAVAQRFDWHILTEGGDDLPHFFMIEKKVRYDLIRGWPMHALYQIIGSFQTSPNGDTTMRYQVSGQPWIPLLHASAFIGGLLLITLLLRSLVFSPAVGGNWIGLLLMGVLLVSMGVYGWFAYRSYQGHLRELSRFMEEFAQRMAAQPATFTDS